MLVRSPKSRSCAFILAGTAVRVRPIKFMVARTASALRVRPLQAASPRSDAVRQQSFSCISSSPLRLSRRPQSPLIIGAADDPAPANPSPREQVCSQPAVGFVEDIGSVLKGVVKVRQRQLVNECSGLLLRSSFAILAARARHLFSARSMPAFSVASRPSNSSDIVRPAGMGAAR